MSLYPVSNRSTRNAIREVIGSENIADNDVCDRYHNRMDRDQSVMLSGLIEVSVYRMHTAKFARSEAGFSANGYVTGALIFFAAAESQAKYLKSTVKELSEDEFSAWSRATTMELLSAEDRASLTAIGYNLTPDRDLKSLIEAPGQAFSAVQKRIIASPESYGDHPLPEQYREQVEKIAAISFGAASVAVSQFLTDEPGFTSFMKDRWDASPSLITAGQQMGACDMRSLLQSAGVE